jgi:hypothetical protein
MATNFSQLGCSGQFQFAIQSKIERHARTCLNDSTVIVFVVPGSTNSCETDCAVVRRIGGRVDDLSRFFSSDTPAGLHLCALAYTARSAAAPVFAAHRPVGIKLLGITYHSVVILEAGSRH